MMLLAVTVLCCGAAAGAEAATKEHQIKAAFLYNFTKFITWPAQGEGAKEPFVIGVLGRNPFGNDLANIARGRNVGGRQLLVVNLATVEEARGVNLLFVPAGEEARLGNALGSLHAASVLTVGESSRFAALGGIITFSMADDKIRFSINREAGSRAGLKISPQLLKLAISSRPGK